MAARNNRKGVTIRGEYSRCYLAPAAYACAVMSHNRSGDAGGVLWGQLRGYMTPPTVLCSANECSAFEGSSVEC
jgi:hypothetical protein